MPSELETPTRRTDPETTTDSSVDGDADLTPFPYDMNGDTDPSGGLPTATASGTLEPTAKASRATGSVGSTACPDCGGETVNGAGLFTCLECAWTGALR